MGTVGSRAKLIELTAGAVMEVYTFLRHRRLLSLLWDDEEGADGENGQGGGVEGVCMSIASKTHWQEAQNLSWQLQPLILNNRIVPPASSRAEWQMVWDIAVIKAWKLCDPLNVRRLHWSKRVQHVQLHLTPWSNNREQAVMEGMREEQLKLLLKESIQYYLVVRISSWKCMIFKLLLVD